MKYFEFLGENNRIIISDNKKIYNLKSYKRLSEYMSYGDGVLYAGYEYVKVFFIPESSETAIVSFYIERNKTKYGIRALRWISGDGVVGYAVEVHYTEGTTLDASDIVVYIFDVGVYAFDNYGLEVKNSDGTTIFHSSDFTLNVVSAASIKETSQSGDIHHDWEYDYGNKKVAISFSSASAYNWIEIFGFFDVAFRARSFPIWNEQNGLPKLKFYYTEIVDIYAYGESAVIAFNSSFYCFAGVTEILIIDVTNAPVPP